MENKSRRERVDELLEERAREAGVSLVRLSEMDRENPHYSTEAESNHKMFTEALSLNILESLARVRVRGTPTPDCLLPYEAEEFSRVLRSEEMFPSEFKAHLAGCSYCKAVLKIAPEDEFLSNLAEALRAGQKSTTRPTSLYEWLSESEWSTQELANFLRQDSPLLELTSSLDGRVDKTASEQILAKRLAALIQHHPSFHVTSEEETEFVETLLVRRALELAALLPQCSELGESIKRLDTCKPLRRILAEGSLLSNALSAQQPWEVTLSKVQRKLKDLATATHDPTFQNFEKSLRIATGADSFFVDEVFESLGSVARILENRVPQSRRQEFSGILGPILIWFRSANDDWASLLLADKHKWPVWAVQCLPRLFAVNAVNKRTDWVEALIWRPLAYVALQEISSRPIERLCGGEVIRLTLPSRDMSVYMDLAGMLDHERAIYAYQSGTACSVTATEALRNAAFEKYSQFPELKRNVDEASVRVLQEMGVGAALVATSGS